jgi:hypothetical protein
MPASLTQRLDPQDANPQMAMRSAASYSEDRFAIRRNDRRKNR